MKHGAGLSSPILTPMNHPSRSEVAGTDSEHLASASPIDPDQHPMGQHLLDYVQSKVHHLVKQRVWKTIIVVGLHCRTNPYIVSNNEKSLKRFNWFRPTARVIDDGTLEIACFPGKYYVHHYALVIATYLGLVGPNTTSVKFERSPDAMTPLSIFSSQLEALGQVDTVIVGYVDRLEDVIPGEWCRLGTDGNDILSWKVSHEQNRRATALLACMVSFWGDISRHLIQALAKHGMTRFLYVGKGAALQQQHRPNEVLATGDESRLDPSTIISWKSAINLDKIVSEHIVSGTHANVPSPLLSDNTWTARQRALGSIWADSEVGLMAEQCQKLGISFGWMHVVSDNLTSNDEARGLWNEDASVQQRRTALLEEAGTVLKGQLGG